MIVRDAKIGATGAALAQTAGIGGGFGVRQVREGAMPQPAQVRRMPQVGREAT
jgi:hypothetical protein